MARVQKLNRDIAWGEISFVLTNDCDIQRINQAHLGCESVTDVISFLFDPIPGDDGVMSAEVIVNTDRAVEEGARRHNWNASRELALYLAHGCNHLLGETDNDDAGRKRMRRRELRWLRGASDQSMLDSLLRE